MLHPTVRWLGLVTAAALGFSAAAGRLADPATGFSERPIGTQSVSAAMAEQCVQFFRDKNFGGDMTQISEVTAKTAWDGHSFETKSKHFSSVRWNLPRGVIVTLFAGPDCTGKCMSVWGSGEVAELSTWKMNDDLAGWSWNYIGGVAEPSKTLKNGMSERPKYAKVAEGVQEDSLHLFKNRDVKGEPQLLEHITDKPANTYQEMPKGISSLKWKLPEGVVVMFSEKADGVGPNLAIWGSAAGGSQFDTLALWQMNDKLKYWSWQYVGEKK